ncbi:MAG: hypothetical protein ACYS3N_05775 [Planctomycetota bacterium]|jgi:hypothetical protein
MYPEQMKLEYESAQQGRKKRAYTKRQVIDHIHRLLVIQLKRTEPRQRRCVLRDGQIRLIAPSRLRPTDLVIVDNTENKDFLPLRTVIHHGVNENWDVLNAVDITR